MKTELGPTREMVDLSGFWHFRTDPEAKGENEEWFALERYLEWDKIYAPAPWNEQASEYAWYMGKAWYAREFFVPKDWSDKLVLLSLDGVNYYAKIWVNGIYRGEHEGGFTPFTFRTEKHMNFGEENRIVIMVDNTLSRKTIPPGEGMNNKYFGFFHYGGIHREVRLLALPRLHIDDVTIRTDIQGRNGIVDFDLDLSNETDLEVTGKLIIHVIDKKEVVAMKTLNLTINPHARMPIKDELTIDDAKFWEVESPNLYLLRVCVADNMGTRDIVETRFGVRTIKIENGRILLNGRPVFLKGVCRHEDFPILGKTLHGAILRRDFDLMTDLGANSFRTSHYPYSRSHLDLADENGFLVILELPTVGITKEKKDGVRGLERLDDPEMIEKARKMLGEMIQRDKNRPSVIMYSLFNEPSSHFEEFRTFLKELKEEAKRMDPTRPVTFASDHHQKEEEKADKALDIVDVICMNFYFGWYGSERGNLKEAESTLDDRLEWLHGKYPNKPIIVSEFGAEAMAGLHTKPPEMWSEEYQAEFIRTYWKVLTSKDYIYGGHIWVFADFKIGQDWPTTMNRKGLFTRTREPKLAASVVKDLFSKTPTYR